MIMKEIRELSFEELTWEQKVGMAMVASVENKESFEYTLELVKKRRIGAIWISYVWGYKPAECMKAFREAADYPILFFTDAESGLGEHLIGRHNALGMTGSEELAYAFGKVTAIEARKRGINVVCNPLLDMANGNFACGTNGRSIGNNKETVARLAAAEAQGMHDGGVLTVGKHYPGSGTTDYIDSHMAETGSDATLEELLDYNLYPYKYLIDRGLLDGVMTKHTRFYKIDDEYPASLSKKVIDIIRDRLSFDGFCVTDALVMMGIVARFGSDKSKGMSIEAGNDLALVWGNAKDDYEKMCRCYNEGVISEEMLNSAVKRVLEAQHKLMLLPENVEIAPEDEERFSRINRDSIFARTDDGVPTEISRDGRHFFIVMTDMDFGGANSDGKITVDTLTKGWYKPEKIVKALEERFPSSTCMTIKEFPSRFDVRRALEAPIGYDDVVFVSFFDSAAYVGRERFTPRIISLIEAMQVTDRVSTVVYFGNPYVLEDLPHVSRVIIGPSSEAAVDAGLSVLAGEYPAKGVMTYDVKFK